MSFKRLAKELYFNNLSVEDKARYVEKLTISVDNDNISIPDPFADIDEDDWNTGTSTWPKIEMAHIISYFIKKPGLYSLQQLENYKSLEGYDYVVSGKVGIVATKAISESGGALIYLRAEVAHSQSLSVAPVNVWVIVKTNVSLVSGHCTCVAGLGEACVHIAAVVFKVELHTRLGLALQTVTDKACTWRQTIKKVPLQPISDVDWSAPKSKLAALASGPKKKKIAKAVPDVDVDSLYSDMKKKAPNAVFWQMAPSVTASSSTDSCSSDIEIEQQPYMLKTLKDDKFRNLNVTELYQQCVEVASSLQITDEEVATVEQYTRHQRLSSMWYAVRNGRITSSIFGKYKMGSVLTASMDEVHRLCNTRSFSISSNAIEWGVKHESVAKQALHSKFTTSHDAFVLEDCGFFISKENPYLGSSPDAIAKCTCHGKALIEIKCPYSCRNEKPETAPYLVCKNDVWHLDEKSEYFAQVQGQMAVCGINKCYFVVWTLKGLFYDEVEFNTNYWCHLVRRLNNVFVHLVLPLLLTGDSEVPPDQLVDKSSFWCHCKKYLNCRLVRCSNELCEIGFFHYDCLKMKRNTYVEWFCSVPCKQSLHKI